MGKKRKSRSKSPPKERKPRSKSPPKAKISKSRAPEEIISEITPSQFWHVEEEESTSDCNSGPEIARRDEFNHSDKVSYLAFFEGITNVE